MCSCNKQQHEHFILAVVQTSENTVLYGYADCGLEFEEVTETSD